MATPSKEGTMSSRSPFFILPCEVRLIIYREYFMLADGYIPSSNLQRLTTSSGKPIKLDLMYTCKLIAQETKRLPLSVNMLTFSTLDSEYFITAANIFQRLNYYVLGQDRPLLEKLSCLIDDDLYPNVINESPLFKTKLDNLTNRNRYIVDGLRVTSQDDQSTSDMFKLLMSVFGSDLKKPMEKLSPAVRMMEVRRSLLNMTNSHHMPWTIPTWDELHQMSSTLARQDADFSMFATQLPRPLKCCFSAAAASIVFLNSIPQDTRHQIRNIILHEDSPGVAYPACHVQGLIPFCKENPHVRIERRINIWRACFSEHYDRYSHSLSGRQADITVTLSKWLTEALALVPAGMPPRCMVTFFDANPAPEAGSLIFQNVIQQDLALMRLVEMPQGRVDPSDRHLASSSATIRCNFNPGEMRDAGQGNNSMEFWKWWQLWLRRDPFSFPLTHPFENLGECFKSLSPTVKEFERMTEYAKRIQLMTHEEHKNTIREDALWSPYTR